MRSITSFRYQIIAFIALVFGLRAGAADTGRNAPVLHRALELADLNNWGEAEPEFVRAASVFRANGDGTGLEFAELGVIRATIQRRNLALTSEELEHRLDSDPRMKSDRDLRISCLAIKGDIDGEMGAAAMRRDWEEVARLAPDASDRRWQYRASAELGMAAFYEGDLQTARKNISAALIAATEAHDAGSQIKYLYAIGLGLNQARMNTERFGTWTRRSRFQMRRPVRRTRSWRTLPRQMRSRQPVRSSRLAQQSAQFWKLLGNPKRTFTRLLRWR